MKLLIISFLALSIKVSNLYAQRNPVDQPGVFYPEIEQRSVILGQITNIKDFSYAPRSIKLACNDITINDQHSFETTIDDSGRFVFDIPLYHSINTYLYYGDSRITPYLFPNDTLHISCEITKSGFKFGFVSGKFDEKHDKFENAFMSQHYWIHYQQLNPFNDNLSKKQTPQELKNKYLDFEKALLDSIESRVIKDSLSQFLADYLKYTAKYSIYDNIIKHGRNIENAYEKKQYFAFLTDSIVFNKAAMITQEYNSFINNYHFDVETKPDLEWDNKTRTEAQFRQDISIKQFEQNLKTRQGVWAEYIAAQQMYHTAFLEEEIDLSVISTYTDLIENKINDPYIKQLLLSKCNSTALKIAEVKKLPIPETSTLCQYDTLSGEGLLNKILKNSNGKAIYIDIWATWCSPCKRQIPHSVKLQNEYQDVDFYYLCCRSNEKTWKKVIRQYQIPGTHILINDKQYEYLKNKFSITEVPHYILYDKTGNIYFNDYPGCKTEIVMENKLKVLVEK
jgi:thiol-disulfide isomerase/thioredoxin